MNKRLKLISTGKYLRVIIPIIVLAVIPVALVVGANNQGRSIHFPLASVFGENSEGDVISGLRGWVEVGYVNPPESGSNFTANRGERVTIPIFISFTSYDPSLKSLNILIDPSKENFGGRTCQYWYRYDSKGTTVASGEICNNHFISYDKQGIVTIAAGDRVELNMFVDIPSDLPPLELEGLVPVAAGIGMERHEPGVGFSDGLGGRKITFDE